MINALSIIFEEDGQVWSLDPESVADKFTIDSRMKFSFGITDHEVTYLIKKEDKKIITWSGESSIEKYFECEAVYPASYRHRLYFIRNRELFFLEPHDLDPIHVLSGVERNRVAVSNEGEVIYIDENRSVRFLSRSKEQPVRFTGLDRLIPASLDVCDQYLVIGTEEGIVVILEMGKAMTEKGIFKRDYPVELVRLNQGFLIAGSVKENRMDQWISRKHREPEFALLPDREMKGILPKEFTDLIPTKHALFVLTRNGMSRLNLVIYDIEVINRIAGKQLLSPPDFSEISDIRKLYQQDIKIFQNYIEHLVNTKSLFFRPLGEREVVTTKKAADFEEQFDFLSNSRTYLVNFGMLSSISDNVHNVSFSAERFVDILNQSRDINNIIILNTDDRRRFVYCFLGEEPSGSTGFSFELTDNFPNSYFTATLLTPLHSIVFRDADQKLLQVMGSLSNLYSCSRVLKQVLRAFLADIKESLTNRDDRVSRFFDNSEHTLIEILSSVSEDYL